MPTNPPEHIGRPSPTRRRGLDEATRSPNSIRRALMGRSLAEQEAMLSPRGASSVQLRPAEPRTALPTDFDDMWAAHPHNYLEDDSQNTTSEDVNEAQGWDPDQYLNTCAVRLSIMWNQLGGDYTLTRDKAQAAGLDRRRLSYSRKTGWYYILSAREMWTYVKYWHGNPHKQFPASGRFKDDKEFQQAYTDEIQPLIASRKGVAAFDKIFGYSGTGHVDIFNGEQLSDGSWYACRSLMLWFV